MQARSVPASRLLTGEAYGIYLQYSFDEAVVADGLVLAIDTNRNNFTASNGFKPLTFSEFPMASE